MRHTSAESHIFKAVVSSDKIKAQCSAGCRSLSRGALERESPEGIALPERQRKKSQLR